MRVWKWSGAVLAVLVLLMFITLAPRDEAVLVGAPEEAHLLPNRVMVIDHGWHSGVVVRTADLRAAALARARPNPEDAAKLRWLSSRFPQAEWLEIGWGDRAVYTATPDLGSLDLWDGLRALAVPTPSVLQVVPGRGAPDQWFRGGDQVTLQLSPAGFARLAEGIAEAIPDRLPAEPVAPALYGGGVFYPSRLDYHLLRTCNHWISGLLRRAGVPSSPMPGTFSATLMAELHWRL